MADADTSSRSRGASAIKSEEPIAGNTPSEDVIVISRTTLGYIVFACILFLGAYIAGWAMGTSSTANTAAIRTVVQEAMATSLAGLSVNGGVAAAQPQQPSVQDPNQRFSVSIDGNPTIGPDNAPVTLIEFSDFQCPFCKRFHDETLPALLKKYEGKVRLVYRDFPISAIHPYAQVAAEAADCAIDQGKFWEYHDVLFQNQQRLTKDDLFAYAKQLNLDMRAFQNCFDSAKYAQEVLDDLRAGEALGVTGTPTFFINGRPLVGAQPASAFSAIIDAELAVADTPATPNAAS